MLEMFVRDARRCIELAEDEAGRLGQSAVGTEHILLGLIREGEGGAVRVLAALGVDLAAVRQQVVQLLDSPDEG